MITPRAGTLNIIAEIIDGGLGLGLPFYCRGIVASDTCGQVPGREPIMRVALRVRKEQNYCNCGCIGGS